MPDDVNVPLRLPSSLDFSGVQKLAEDLRTVHIDNLCVQIDAGDVDRIGTPAAQVLFAAALQADGDGQRFEVVNKTENFSQAFEDLGLSDQVKKWSKD